MAGFHHVVNRGIERSNVYRLDRDKEKFLEILCKACNTYKVNVHDYCLMDNHYHILIETTSENLSLFMRQINSKEYKLNNYQISKATKQISLTLIFLELRGVVLRQTIAKSIRLFTYENWHLFNLHS